MRQHKIYLDKYLDALIIYRLPFVIELVNSKIHGRTPPENRIKDEAENFRKFVTAIAETLTKKL